MYFTYSNTLTCYSGGSIQRWQFLTHKNFLALKCPRKSSHAWFTYLNFKTKISSEKHLKLIMNKTEKNENVSKNVSVSRSIQSTNHFVTKNTRHKWAKQLLNLITQKGLRQTLLKKFWFYNMSKPNSWHEIHLIVRLY